MSVANTTLAVERSTGKTQVGQRIEVDTRFGRHQIDAANAIHMPRGPHGFGGMKTFALLDVPGAEQSQFKLLQSLDDAGVSFVVAPLANDGVIAADDIRAAARERGLSADELLLLAIVTVRKDDDGQVAMTANLRAPLLVDTASHEAYQHIFAQADYPIRAPIRACLPLAG